MEMAVPSLIEPRISGKRLAMTYLFATSRHSVTIQDEDVRCVGGDKSDDGSVKGSRS